MNPPPIKDGIFWRIRALLLRQAALSPVRNPPGAGRRRLAAGYEPLDGRVRRYEEEIEQLRLENEHLRLSATTFGDLAERLNKSLKNARGRDRTPLA